MQRGTSGADLVAAFLDVGQGDATAVILPGGESAVVVDCPSGQAHVVLDFLERHGVRHLELVVVSHSDFDHVGGVADLLTRFTENYSGSVRRLAYLADRFVPLDPAKLPMHRLVMTSILNLCIQRGVAYQIPHAGITLSIDNVAISFLHPTYFEHDEAVLRDLRNDGSVVLRIEYQGKRLLLGADVRGQGWQWMIDRGEDLKADVFKFPHHGAAYRRGFPLRRVMDRVAPTLVVLSAGSGNSYRHPALSTFRMLLRHSHRTGLRFVCTQATYHCQPSVARKAPLAHALLTPESRGGQASSSRSACPCAGTVIVRVSAAGIKEAPTQAAHDKVIDLFHRPKCREQQPRYRSHALRRKDVRGQRWTRTKHW